MSAFPPRLPRRAIAVVSAIAALATLRAQSDDMRAVEATGITPGSISNPAGRTLSSSFPSTPEVRRSPQRVYFPPTPPPLDHPLLSVPPKTMPAEADGALELGEFAHDIFYPRLAALLAPPRLTARSSPLPAAPMQRLRDYLADKLALQREIRVEVERTADLPLPERVAALRALAQEEAARLAALEQAAEQLRKQLAAPEDDWRALREWRLGDGKRADSPSEIAHVMLAAAFYQDGLSLAQRDLLRMCAQDISRGATAGAAPQPYLTFLPAPARLALPGDGATQLVAKAADYEARLSDLRNELSRTITETDKRGESARRSALAALAPRHEAALRALDAVAEEIRVLLAKEPAMQPVRRQLPEALAQKLAAVAKDRHAVEQETLDRLAEIRTRFPEIAATARLRPGDLEWRSGVSLGASGAPSDLAKATMELTRLAGAHRRHCLEVAEDAERLRAPVLEALRAGNPGASDAALNRVVEQLLFHDGGDPYADFRIAALTPGLSLSQRRVMFDAAVTALDLKPPAAELQPVARLRR